MKTYQFASGLLIFLLISTANTFGQSENEILGTWYNTEKSAQIEIVKIGSGYHGKIVKLENAADYSTPPVDSKNENQKLRTRPIEGLTILDGLKYADGIWKEGKIYDPNSGKTYSCEVRLKNPSVLEVKGYLGFSWVGRTVEWTKVKK
jgi:uncharacterized protein (DUF2147 family)